MLLSAVENESDLRRQPLHLGMGDKARLRRRAGGSTPRARPRRGANRTPFTGVGERLLALASEPGLEGREGRPVGALFIVGDSDRVLAQSRQLVINPFRGDPEEDRNVLDARPEETIREFSAIDGAFIIRGGGVILGAGRD